jgi:hypothetical protein
MSATEKIVSVWLDETDDEGAPYVVDTDTREGGQSETIKCFRDRDRAIAFAAKAAEKRGLDLDVRC